jgi:hypothetical protein
MNARFILRWTAIAACWAAIGEITARVIFAAPPLRDRVVGRDDDVSSRVKWAARHVADLSEPGYSFAAYDSVRGWRLRPSISRQRVFDDRVLSSDSAGFRGAREYSRERAPGAPRIVALGDSYTFGDEVSDSETFAAVLERELPSGEVLNLGMSGYGHDQMLLAYEQTGERYRPDVVLVGVVWFDMYRDLAQFTSYAKPRFVIAGDSLRLEGVPVPRPADLLRAEPWHSKLWELASIASGRIRTRFDRIASEAQRSGATPVFVYFPVLTELLDRSSGYTAHEQFLARYCASRHARCLFLRPAFLAAEQQGERFNTRSHWHASAHALAGHAIARFLQDSILSASVASRR